MCVFLVFLTAKIKGGSKKKNPYILVLFFLGCFAFSFKCRVFKNYSKKLKINNKRESCFFYVFFLNKKKVSNFYFIFFHWSGVNRKKPRVVPCNQKSPLAMTTPDAEHKNDEWKRDCSSIDIFKKMKDGVFSALFFEIKQILQYSGLLPMMRLLSCVGVLLFFGSHDFLSQVLKDFSKGNYKSSVPKPIVSMLFRVEIVPALKRTLIGESKKKLMRGGVRMVLKRNEENSKKNGEFWFHVLRDLLSEPFQKLTLLVQNANLDCPRDKVQLGDACSEDHDALVGGVGVVCDDLKA